MLLEHYNIPLKHKLVQRMVHFNCYDLREVVFILCLFIMNEKERNTPNLRRTNES